GRSGDRRTRFPLPRRPASLRCCGWLVWSRSCVTARDRVEDVRGVLRGRLLPDEVAGVDDPETAVGQPHVEKLGVGDRYDAVVAAIDDRDRRRDLWQELGERGQLRGI